MDRFKLISKQELKVRFTTDTHAIIKDTITGILYYYTAGGANTATMTPLLGSDGKPIIEKPE